MMNIKLQLQNKKIQLENIELQYTNSGFMPDLETVNTSFEIIDIGLELLKVGMGMNLNQISNQIFQFQMQLQNIILKMQNLGIQNQNMGMNPIINNNAFFNNGGNVMNSNNQIKVYAHFTTLKGHSTIIVSNYETPINKVFEKYLNKFNIPIDKRKNVRFMINGSVIREDDHTSIGNHCFCNDFNITIVVNDAFL